MSVLWYGQAVVVQRFVDVQDSMKHMPSDLTNISELCLQALPLPHVSPRLATSSHTRVHKVNWASAGEQVIEMQTPLACTRVCGGKVGLFTQHRGGSMLAVDYTRKSSSYAFKPVVLSTLGM